jgi:uncharacterized protein involved in exopolysaccharide biosynthesis
MSLENQKYCEDEIDLFELFEKLWKRKKIIFSITLLGTLIATLVAFTIPKQYTSESSIVVVNINTSPSLSLDEGSLYILSQLNFPILPILNSKDLAEKVLKNNNLNIEPEKFIKNNLKNEKLKNEKNEVFRISISWYNPNTAKKLNEDYLIELKKVVNQFLTQLENQYQKRLELLNIEYKKAMVEKDELKMELVKNQVEKISSIYYLLELFKNNKEGFIKVVNSPSYPTAPSKPKKGLILAIGFVSSLFLSLFVALVVEAWENRRKNKVY